MLYSEERMRLSQGEERVFNAEFKENEEKILVEISLTPELEIEYLWCSCDRGQCRHIAAALIGADLMIRYDRKDFSEIEIGMTNS